MLTPNDLLRIADGAESIGEQLNTYITNAIVSRIVTRLERKENYIITSLDKWQLGVAQESGILLEDITRGIAQATKLQEEELKKAIQEAGVEAVTPIDGKKPQISRRMSKLMEYNHKITMGEWNNFTGTHANASQQTFIRECDKAYHLVTSGTVSCAQAVSEAVDNIAKDGTKVEYPSGHKDSIETATLRAVRTSISKMSMEMVLDNMKEIGADIVLVSAHLGARDKGVGPMNHASWQGQFYSLSGNDKRFKPFYETTGYGTGEGLGGYNCRHSIGIGDGVNNPYGNIDTEENRKAYQLSQRQRQLERRIRNTRRAVEALETAKDTATEPDVKTKLEADYKKKVQLLKKQNKDYRDFCKQNNLKPKYDRLQTAKTVKNEQTVDSEDIIDEQKTVEKSGESGNILSQDEVIEKAKSFAEASDYDSVTSFKELRAVTNAKLGYDGLPKVLQEREFGIIAKGKTKLYRGIHSTSDKTARQIVDEFKFGNLWTGNSGGAKYGNGVYFATAKEVACNSEYMGFDGELVTGILEDGAKIADYQSLMAEYESIYKMRFRHYEPYHQIIADIGQYAAMKGYDAIASNGFQGDNYIVLLNRTKLIVKG